MYVGDYGVDHYLPPGVPGGAGAGCGGGGSGGAAPGGGEQSRASLQV